MRYTPSLETVKCSKCGQALSPLQRGDSSYCSAKCRVAAHRSAPPMTLRTTARWIRWSADKVPLTIKGNAASSTNPTTWSDYESAAASTVGVGFGFVLSNDDRIVCVDLDHCLDGRGRPLAWAVSLLETLPATYVEVSPSGRGLHVWGFGDVDRARCIKGIEVYGSRRYITVTNRRWRHSKGTFTELNSWIDSLPI
jgi:primase-polymerase (primpol)-like protein